MPEAETVRQQPRRRSTLFSWLWAVILLPVLYVASVGPMAPVLTRHTGNTGYRMWDILYNEPLSKLPRSCLGPLNGYIGFWSKLDMKYIR